MGLNFFSDRPYFIHKLSGVHNCKDCFNIHFFNCSAHIWFHMSLLWKLEGKSLGYSGAPHQSCWITDIHNNNIHFSFNFYPSWFAECFHCCRGSSWVHLNQWIYSKLSILSQYKLFKNWSFPTVYGKQEGRCCSNQWIFFDFTCSLVVSRIQSW